MSSKGLGGRDVTDYFDSHSYYRFHNKNRPNEDLVIADEDGDGDGDVNMGQFNTTSSENWQIYYQQGRWFIRPYASSVTPEGTEYQLGLTQDNKGNVGALPKLAKRSGELGQQWTFAQVDDGDGGFGYRISNALLGNRSFLAVTGIAGQPGMQSSSEGSVWDMQVNRQAGDPGRDNSYDDVKNFEVATSSSASLVLSTASATSISTSASTPSSTPTSTSSAAASTSSSLGSGAIAGLVVGAVLVILAAAGAFIFFARRHKRSTSAEPYHNLELSQETKVTYAHLSSPVEIGSDAVVHMGGYQQERYELGSNDVPSTRSASRSHSVTVHGEPMGKHSA